MSDATRSGASPSRPFLAPMFGLTALFAFLGPLVGAVLFLPLAFLLAAPPVVAATAHVGWFVAMLGHAVTLIPAYLIGLAPAAAAGFLYAFWDYFAPPRFPRTIAAAAIGAMMAHGVGVWLGSLGAEFIGGVTSVVGTSGDDWIGELFTPDFAAALLHSLEACGAVAGAVAAMTAKLFGLTMAPPQGTTSAPSRVVGQTYDR